MSGPADFFVRCDNADGWMRRCKRQARWYLEHHKVDNCSESEQTESALLCDGHFRIYTDEAIDVLAAFEEGERGAKCKKCSMFFLKLSDIIKDVGHL